MVTTIARTDNQHQMLVLADQELLVAVVAEAALTAVIVMKGVL